MYCSYIVFNELTNEDIKSTCFWTDMDILQKKVSGEKWTEVDGSGRKWMEFLKGNILGGHHGWFVFFGWIKKKRSETCGFQLKKLIGKEASSQKLYRSSFYVFSFRVLDLVSDACKEQAEKWRKKTDWKASDWWIFNVFVRGMEWKRMMRRENPKKPDIELPSIPSAVIDVNGKESAVYYVCVGRGDVLRFVALVIAINQAAVKRRKFAAVLWTKDKIPQLSPSNRKFFPKNPPNVYSALINFSKIFCFQKVFFCAAEEKLFFPPHQNVETQHCRWESCVLMFIIQLWNIFNFFP